jgi:uncharacterized protein YgiM (DUF1202 family)
MNKKLVIGLVCFSVSFAVQAETVYVKERQTVGLRDGVTPQALVVKDVASGIGLEVVQRVDTNVKVRLTDGSEGWISAAFLTSDKPAALKILAAETRQKQAETELTKLRAELAQMQAKLSQQKQAALAADTANAQEPQDIDAPGTQQGPSFGIKPFSIDVVWIGISFAMLVLGFFAGVAWLRERTRRRLGGMHIRVS